MSLRGCPGESHGEEDLAFSAGFGDRCLAQLLQQLRGGFVVGVLGDEVAAEGFAEGGGGQALHLGSRRRQAGFDPVGQRKQRFDSADDFGLFGEWRNRHWQLL